jgi:hypothetical protein
MTTDERKQFDYIREERLGILQAARVPTPEQDRIATAEAFADLHRRRKVLKEMKQ